MKWIFAPVRCGRIGLMWLCAGLSPLVQAQRPADEIVVTAERQPQQSADVAASIATVSGEELREVAPVHPAELLNRVAGVNINRGNGQEHLTSLRSPVLTGGAGAGSFLYLEDGVPLRAAGFANVNGLFEANTEFASGLEVFRGPGSVLYGSNALHGLINVLSPDAREAYNRATVWVGPHGNTSLSATLQLPGEDGAWLLAGHAGHDGGYRASSGYDQQKAMLRYNGTAGDWEVGGKLAYQNLNQDTAGYVLGESAYKDLELVKGNDDPDAYRDAMSVRAQGEFRRALAGGLELHLTPYARYTDMEFLMHFQPGQALEKNSHDSLGLLTTVYGGGDTFSYLAGFDIEYSRGELSEFQQQPTMFSFVQGAHYDYEVSALVASPYVSLEWPLGEDTRLEVGVRYDYTHYDYGNRLPDGTAGRFLRIADRDDTFHTATPKLTLTHSLSDGLNVYARLARGSRAPQTTDLYRLQINQTEGRAEAETLDIVEAGLKYRGENFSFDTAVYAMQKENFFFRDAQGFNVTDGATDHYGIEADVQVVLNDWLIVSGDVSLARHRYDFSSEIADPANATESIRDGDDVDTAPRKFWNLRLEGNWSKLSAEIEWRHVGKYYTDAANQHRYPGHDVWVLRGGYQFSPNVSLHARIDNLTDTRYAERADYAFGNTRYFPGEERAYYIGLTVSK
ncbi:MAG TPA: TonB-dependent receptor [Gammaproteobacteria bacterium]